VRMKRRTYLRLRTVSLCIIGLSVLAIIGGALAGCSNPGGASPGPSPTPTPTLAHATIAPKAAPAPATHKHHRRKHHHTAATPAATSPPPAAGPTGCYPLSDEGTCYEPGEYCRDSDHGASGVAGDGESIICEDNDGWRWEPA